MHSMEKWVTRSDAWTPVDDERLADIVLRHIRTGSTQLKAFEEAGNELGRTPAACGYRWNGVLRKDCRQEIEEAKQARKDAQKVTANSSTDTGEETFTPVNMTSTDSMKEVLQFLQSYDEQYQSLRKQLAQLEVEKSALQVRLSELETHHAVQPAQAPQGHQVQLPGDASLITPAQLEQDSRTLFAIMERARRLLEPDHANSQAE